MGLDPRDPIDVMKGLPHVYPFVLIDRVVELGASRGVGIKNVSGNSFFSYGRPAGPLYFPDVFLIEAMAQLSGLVMNFGSAVSTAGVLAAVKTMRFEKHAAAGDSIVIISALEGSFGTAASFDVEASVGSILLAAGRLTLACAQAEVPSGRDVSGRQIR